MMSSLRMSYAGRTNRATTYFAGAMTVRRSYLCLMLIMAGVGTVAAGSAPVAAATVAARQDAAGLESGRLSDDAIDSVGEQVMSGQEFRSVRRRVLEQLPEVDVDKGFLGTSLSWLGDRIGDVFNAIADFFRWLFGGQRSPNPNTPNNPPVTSSAAAGGDGFSQLLTAIAILAIVAVLVVIIAMVVKSVDARKQQKENLLSDLSDVLSDVVTPPGELAASTYESRAINLAADGQHRLAIRELLLGSMSWIERAGLIRYRKGLTNRDYLRAVWRRHEKRRAFLATATQFEFVYFGRREPTAEMFEQCLHSFREAFHEEETPTAAA
jgi:hypothetical protein